MTVDQVIKGYVALRDKIAQREAEFKASIAGDKAKLGKLGQYLLAESEKQGVDSFKTEHGTAFRKVQNRVSVGDWDAFFPWAEESGNTQMLKRDVKSTEVVAFMEANDGEIPPGIEFDRAYTINVNRPRGK